MSTTVTTKGQVTIPKPVRGRLGIVPGSAGEFLLALDGQVVLVKVEPGPPTGHFNKLRGLAGTSMSTDEIMAFTRGDG